ncbi:MAG: Trm112 family protein [bacterium]
MFIELVDALRCPVPHEESWLVAAAMRMEARHIVEGTLGCPVCAAEYPIRDGVVDFRHSGGPVAAAAAGDPEQAMRLAALLNLDDAQGFAVLLGAWGAHAHELASLVDAPLVLVDPPADVIGAPGVSVLRCDGLVPLAAGAARAIAIDDGDAARVLSAVRATRVKGRVVAPVTVPVPVEVTELARDERMWVGERGAAVSPLVSLHVRRST